MEDSGHLDASELFWIMIERIKGGISQQDLVATYGVLAVYCFIDDIRYGNDYSHYLPGITDTFRSRIIGTQFEKVKKRILLQ